MKQHTHFLLTAPLLLSLGTTSLAFAPLSTGTPRPMRSISASTSTALQATTDEAKDPIQMARMRLEMHWSLEEHKGECLVEDPSTCGSEECTECLGTGQSTCRFCRGTMQNYYNGNFVKCPVCDKGTEVCRPCKGTGWIAEWTQLNNEDVGGALRP